MSQALGDREYSLPRKPCAARELSCYRVSNMGGIMRHGIGKDKTTDIRLKHDRKWQIVAAQDSKFWLAPGAKSAVAASQLECRHSHCCCQGRTRMAEHQLLAL